MRLNLNRSSGNQETYAKQFPQFSAIQAEQPDILRSEI